MSISKITLVILAVVFTTSTTFGQFSFGGKLGGASTNLTGNGLRDFTPTPKVKIIGGGIINYSFGDRIALQTELLYSGKGSKFEYYNEDVANLGIVKISHKLGYFAIPVMVQIKLGDKYSYFHIDGGIVSNTIIQDDFEGKITFIDDQGESAEKDFIINKGTNKSDLSYAFGIGLVANGLNFDFRYEIGTKEVYQSGTGNPEVKNKSFQVSVGYTFRY
jgi:hypothetical protein